MLDKKDRAFPNTFAFFMRRYYNVERIENLPVSSGILTAACHYYKIKLFGIKEKIEGRRLNGPWFFPM